MTLPAVENQKHQTLKLRRLGIDTYTDPVIFMNRACHIFRSEGFEARDVLTVLQGKGEAPQDLRERALRLAGAVLELANAAPPANSGPQVSAWWRRIWATCARTGASATAKQ